MKEQQAVSALQDAFKKNGIETRKLPRAAALRVSFMGSFHRVVYAGENKGWLVSGYNEDGDPVKISELQALCEELSPAAIAPVAEEAIGQPPSESDDVEIFTPGEEIEEDAIGIPTPGEEVEIFTPGEEIEKDAIGIPTPGEEVEIFTPGEEIEKDAIGNSKLINQILSLASQLGAEAVVSEEGVCRELTSLALPDCSISELNFILGRLTELSQLVGPDDSEPIPDEQLSEDEQEANAFGAQVVKNFLCGEAIGDIPGIKIGQWTILRTQEDKEAIAPNSESVKRRHYLKWIHKLANLSNVAILPHEAEFLKDPEECPLADLKKIMDRLLSFPKAIASAHDDWRNRDLTDEEREGVRQGEHYNRMMRRYNEMRSRQDDDHGEPINYRPSADKVAS